MIKAAKSILLTISWILASSGVFAGVESKPIDPKNAFLVNDSAFSQKAVAHLLGETKKHNPKLKSDKLLKGLIENNLIVNSEEGYLESLLNEDNDHHDHDHHKEHPENEHSHGHGDGVGHGEYIHDIGINVQAYSEYDQLLNTLAPLDSSVDLGQYIKESDRGYIKQLNELLAIKSDRAMKNEDLNEEQVAQAKKIIVLEFAFGKQSQKISFWDVFSQNNVHERTRLRRVDAQAIQKQGTKVMARYYQEYQIRENTDWSEADLLSLKQFVFDKVKKQKLLKDLGIIADLHHDTPSLKPFVSKVTEQEIDDYYKLNKDQFVQVSSVKARHITVANQGSADQVYQAIKGGMDFVDAVKKYSIADDKATNPKGDLGVINKNSKDLSFRQKLALIQPVGEVSTPYRMLDGKSYEILMVYEKKPEYLTPSDKSVKREIVDKIARKKAAEGLEKFKERLVNNASVVINSIHYPKVAW